MDNDNKINAVSSEQTHKEVQLFLRDELQKLKSSHSSQYNLEKEYALTKKNKNKSVVIILCACALSVILLVAALSFYIYRQNRNIKVNIETFNDLNLKALLNSAGRAESLYANALQAKEILIAQRDDELTAAEQKRENDLYVLSSVSRVSSRDSIARKTAQIQSEYSKTVKSIKEKYEPKIAEADEQLKLCKEKLSGYDTEKLSAAQANEAVLDSQKQLNDIQMSTMEKRYQARIDDLKTQMALQQREAVKQQRQAVENVRKTYQAKIDLLDPDARSQSDLQNQIILETGIPKDAVSASAIEFNKHFDSSQYTSQFKSPSPAFISSLKQAGLYLEDLNTIANRFSTIPLENTIRHYVPAMQRLAYSITTDMAQAQQKMQVQIDSLKTDIEHKNFQISEFEKILDSLCTSDPQFPAQACITDSSDKNKFKLYVTQAGKTLFSQENQTLEAQIRDKKRVLLDLTVTKNGNAFTAVPKLPAKNAGSVAVETGAKVYFLIADPVKK